MPAARRPGSAGRLHPARHDAARHDAARYDAAGHDAARYDAARYDAAGHVPAGHVPAGYDAADGAFDDYNDGTVAAADCAVHDWAADDDHDSSTDTDNDQSSDHADGTGAHDDHHRVRGACAGHDHINRPAEYPDDLRWKEGDDHNHGPGRLRVPAARPGRAGRVTAADGLAAERPGSCGGRAAPDTATEPGAGTGRRAVNGRCHRAVG